MTNREWKSSLGVLAATTLPVLVVLFLVYRWAADKQVSAQHQGQFLQRQNKVLVNDSVQLAHKFQSLLEDLNQDTQLLAELPPTVPALQKFLAVRNQRGPRYSEAIVLGDFDRERLRVGTDGPLPLRTRSQCYLGQLCDREVWDHFSTALKAGEIRFGRVVKYYSPETTSQDLTSAGLTAMYRTVKGGVALKLDYAAINRLKQEPFFPYDSYAGKSGSLSSYEEGNYIYFVDADTSFLVHPKYWHTVGIDRETGGWREPVHSDRDQGSHPLNVAEYRGEKLRSYFDRLLSRSFRVKEVDLFQASNLRGTNRVLSVSPILFSRGQYAQTGVFGHAIVGCSVEHFEEPKEKYIPYY